MKFWYGFGSADPYLWLMDPDPDPDPALSFSDLQDVNKKFFCLLLFEGTFKSFKKSHTWYRSHNESMFFLRFLLDPYLWLMDPDPGGPKRYESYGSGSPKLIPYTPLIFGDKFWRTFSRNLEFFALFVNDRAFPYIWKHIGTDEYLHTVR